jgi:hypothetical protein
MKVEQIETYLVLFLVAVQFYVFVNTFLKIKLFKGIIPDSDNLSVNRILIPAADLNSLTPKDILKNTGDYKENINRIKSEKSWVYESILSSQDLEEITILECSTVANPIFQNIIFSINNYLIRNRHSASDFSLIKDIVERNTDALEEEINLTISIPLYLGLLGTMLGIVIGLFNMSDILGFISGSLTDDNLNAAIAILLGGVKIAMIASFTGLLFTIINSGWIFKGSRSQIDNKKNEFYTFLQIELLPAMNQGLGQTIESLQRNLLSFNGEFSRNLKMLSGIFDKNHETLSMQRDLLELIDRSKVSEMTRYNVKVLQELNVATQQFERFNEYFANLNGYISNSYQITDRLTAILDRTDNFKKIADTLEDKLDQSQQLIAFLTKHFQELDNHKQYVSNSVAEVAHGISDVFVELKEHIQQSSQSIKEFTIEEVEALKKALAESKTNLGNLQFLESLNKDVGQIKINSSNQVDRLKGQVDEVNRNLSKSVQLLEGIEKASKFKTEGIYGTVKNLFTRKKSR